MGTQRDEATRSDEDLINDVWPPRPDDGEGFGRSMPTVFAELLARKQRRDRMLADGFTYGEWNYCPKSRTVEHTKTRYWFNPYEIDQAKKLVEWMCQVNEKSWATPATVGQLFRLLDFVVCGRCQAHPNACMEHDSFGTEPVPASA